MPGRNVFGQNEVSDGHAGLFGNGAEVDKIVGVPVVEGDGDGGHLDPAFPHQFDRLA